MKSRARPNLTYALTLPVAFTGLTLAHSVLPAAAASPKATCQKTKLIALGKFRLCMDKVDAKIAQGGWDSSKENTQKNRCIEKFGRFILRADGKAASAADACRWLDNDDGTVTDLHTGLQWELKTNDGSVHDVGNSYSWSSNPPKPDGDAFTEFLGSLNDADGSGCLAGHCDWRVPTGDELETLVDEKGGGGPCYILPCTTIPGETITGHYLTSTTIDTTKFETLDFETGFRASGAAKGITPAPVRAVRGKWPIHESLNGSLLQCVLWPTLASCS